MKVGIITQPLIDNYGGVLQNFALQQVLRELGHEPLTFDLYPGNLGYRYFRDIAVRCIKRVLGRNVKILVPPFKTRKNPEIKQFVETHISLSRPMYGRYRSKAIKRYGIEAMIVGSDQTWRPIYNYSIEDLFLRFAAKQPIRRVAYAASFGTSDWEYTPEQALACRPLLAKFDAVSVRELSGVTLAARLGCDNALHVLDPTLLLGSKGFNSVISPYKGKPSEPYLGAYILDPSEETTKSLHSMAKSLGLGRVVQFQAGHDGMGPGQWIDAIRSGAFFVCDSFHGCVFAILNHIPFIALVNSSRGADRFYSLLQPLGLQSALYNSLPANVSVEADSYPWDEIDAKLEKQRQISYNFLREALPPTP